MKNFNSIYNTLNVIEAYEYKERHSNTHILVDLSNVSIYFANHVLRDAFAEYVNTHALNSFTAETKLVEFDDVALEKLAFSDDTQIRILGNVELYDFFTCLQSSYILPEDINRGRGIMYHIVPDELVKSIV